MIRKLRVVTAVLGSMLAASLAGAQTRGAGVPARMPSAGIRSAPRNSGPSSVGFAARPPAVRPATVIRILPGGRVVTGFAPSTFSAGFETGNGVPGLGFDYPHLAAISGGLRGDGHRGFDQRGHSGQGFVVPILFGGYPYYLDGSLDYAQPEQQDQTQAYQNQQQPQPQIIVIQQPVAAAASPQAASLQEPNAGTGAAQLSSTQAPVENAGEIILIRKDGHVVFASAFSVVGTQLRYVSPEGVLHRFPVTELDSESTQQMNEARGNTVQINN